MFFLTLALFLGFLNLHALNWITRSFSLSVRVRRTIGCGLAGSLLGLVLGRTLGSALPDPAVSWLLACSGTVQLSVLIGVALLVPADVVRLIAALLRWLRRTQVVAKPLEPSEFPAGDPIPRRALLAQAAAGSAFLIGGSSSLYGLLIGRHDYAIEDFPVRIPGLARALDGFTIVQLSDLHIGSFVGASELAAAEELVRRAKPDLIVLTGDLLDQKASLADTLGRFVRRLAPLAREGVVAISGNHDHYAGIQPIARAIEAAGGIMLRNRGRVVGSSGGAFALLGVEDVWASRFGGGPDLAGAIGSLGVYGGSSARVRDLPRILLCHNPSYFEDAASEVALQLSGHTHGGQVSPVVNPAAWVLKNGWVRGAYEHNGARLYVNRGFGTVGPPARVGSPPEITRVVLTV